MNRLIAALICGCLLSSAALCEEKKPEETTLRQPVFLLCPIREHYSAWSLALIVDKNDPSKPQKFVLEELSQKNGKDDGYAKVYEAQRDPKAAHVEISSLDAKSFGAGSLRIEKDNALSVGLTPDGADYRLTIDMRVNVDTHFYLGGQDAGKFNVVLKYNKALRTWYPYATVLENKRGTNIVGAEPLPITGLSFPVSGTGIYRIFAMVSGMDPVIVFDK